MLARAGHTEAAVDLARLAGLKPVGVMCEILDEEGKAAQTRTIEKLARRYHLKILNIEQLIDIGDTVKNWSSALPAPNCPPNTAPLPSMCMIALPRTVNISL